LDTKFFDILKERVLVFDGATGSNLQTFNLTEDDFGGKEYEGCNEYLCKSSPDVVRQLHSYFLQAGCDIIETNSFGSNSIVLAEYGIAELDYDLSLRAARIARIAADDFSERGKQRFVAGSIGPTTKLPSLGHIKFDEMEAAYYRQMSGLMDGGADIFCIETCQDLLQTKTALSAARKLFEDKKKKLPVIVSVTVETMGTMLMGTDISAALTTIEPYDIVDVFGLNCATGPKEMEENIRYLSHNSPKYIFCMPNAGIPENVGGKACYHLTPEELTKYMTHFVKDLGVNIIGGCCGTGAAHIKALVEISEKYKPAVRNYEYTPAVSSIYSISTLHIDPAPTLIGERCNANGSKKFRELLEREDYDAMVNMAKDQTAEGAHILDVCAAFVGRDEARDMEEIFRRFNTAVQLPLMIDSTEVNVIETALKLYAGRSIINSINFEDGTAKADKILALAKRFGAAVIALSIDEEGQAYDMQKKVDIAMRIHDHAIKVHGLRDEDLIFDMLTFPLGSGQEDLRTSGMNTINAIREIKKLLPKCHTVLGISNSSFGLKPEIRHILNSVFMHFAVEAGLDMVIVHAGKILPLYKVDEKGRELCRQLIFDERKFEEV
jgi:5-methyltetrahydrofolate--homocysteine methyltransferase